MCLKRMKIVATHQKSTKTPSKDSLGWSYIRCLLTMCFPAEKEETTFEEAIEIVEGIGEDETLEQVMPDPRRPSLVET